MDKAETAAQMKKIAEAAWRILLAAVPPNVTFNYPNVTSTELEALLNTEFEALFKDDRETLDWLRRELRDATERLNLRTNGPDWEVSHFRIAVDTALRERAAANEKIDLAKGVLPRLETQLALAQHLTTKLVAWAANPDPAQLEAIAAEAQRLSKAPPQKGDGKTVLTVKQCAEQFRMYAQSHPSPDSQHSLRFCADFLEEFCLPPNGADVKA